MTLTVRNVILDVDDLGTAKAFWAAALGYERAMGEDGIWCALVDPEQAGPRSGCRLVATTSPRTTSTACTWI